jgi:hypothetical protein
LPFADNQFDLVVCSETLEHVPEHTKAISELIRVASKAVVITVPHEPEEEIKENIRNRIIHAHMHSFDLTSFDYLFSYGIRVITTPHISPYWYRVNQVIERVRTAGRAGVFLARLLTTMFIGFDPYLVRSSNGFACILCIILKDSSDRSRNLDRRIRVKEILDHTVPHHFIANKESYQK